MANKKHTSGEGQPPAQTPAQAPSGNFARSKYAPVSIDPSGTIVEAAAPAAAPSRRDFIVLAASSLAAVGGAITAWPFIDSLNPAADVLALSSTEVDLAAIEPGQIVTVLWRGKPVFIRHRTEEEIAAAEKADAEEMRDPQKDAERVQKKQWLVLVGICTHLGCVPLGHSGEYQGWFCPCHGSVYDTSGRIRKGPAPKNLAVPAYSFLSDTLIKIG